MAYLDYGDDAFAYVEKLLLDNLNIQPRDAVVPEQKTQQGEEEDVMNQEWNLPSVGIPCMDVEHEKCEEALSHLLGTLDVDSLTRVMELLTEHFQHEENLMKLSGFGKPSEQFSPYTNHVKDHERILDIGFSELGKLSQKKERNRLDQSFLAMTCSTTSEESVSSSKQGT